MGTSDRDRHAAEETRRAQAVLGHIVAENASQTESQRLQIAHLCRLSGLTDRRSDRTQAEARDFINALRARIGNSAKARRAPLRVESI